MSTDDQRWSRLSALTDPVRRRVYEHVDRSSPCTRDEVADGLGLGRSIVTHHLARLEQEGLVVAEPGPRTGRPGRPAVLYRGGAPPELPGRRYELLARLLAGSLAGAVAGTVAGSTDVRTGDVGSRDLACAARRVGAGSVPARGSDRQRARAALTELGFAPQSRPGRLRATSCPFLAVSAELPEVACSVARALAEGIAEQVQGWSARAVEPERCCVELVHT